MPQNRTKKAQHSGRGKYNGSSCAKHPFDHPAYAPDVPLFDARRVRALENLIGIVEINATSDLKNTPSANFVIKFKKSVTKDKNVDGCIASELTERTHGPRV